MRRQISRLRQRLQAPAFNPISLTDWRISEKQWGGACNAGVIADNVCFDGDGNLVLIANGDNYDGDKIGVGDYVGTYGGTRTGAAVQSRRAYGPGSFETELKLADRNGICNAFWLFNYFRDPSDETLIHNYEIDMEMHGTVKGGDGFDTVLCTNWLTETVSDSAHVAAGYALNDGEFHRYRIDWHTGDRPRVEYYLDGALIRTSTECVPSNEMYVWLGAWFPNKWCGTPDFDVSAMTVKGFRYTPFADERADSVNTTELTGGAALNPEVTVPETDYVSQASLASLKGWTATGVTLGTDGAALSDGALSQVVRFDCYGKNYTTVVRARGGTAELKSEYLDADGAVIRTETTPIAAADDFSETRLAWTAPANCFGVRVTVTAASATVARVSIRLT